jgi:hypothetical protein
MMVTLLGIVLVGCNGGGGTDASQDASLGNPFDLGVGETAVITDADLQVTFKGVPRDSRCPEDVDCSEAGLVDVTLLIAPSSNTAQGETITISAYPRETADTVYGEYSIALEAVAPYPVSTEEIREKDYVITLVVVEAP